MQQFPFTDLSTELALEIIRFACVPDPHIELTKPRPYYATALALSSVSHAVRRAAVPHLLHTVILISADHVLAFIDTIALQVHHHQSHSPLALNYTRLVRRFWSTECWEPLVEESSDNPLNYSALYEIMRSTESLGLNFRSLHLLYNGLESVNANPELDWTCKRVTLAGDFWRWSPLTSSHQGLTCLRQLTHLVVWIPDNRTDPIAPEESPLPKWVHSIPLGSMPNLTHFAVPLLTNRARFEGQRSLAIYAPTEMLVYMRENPKREPSPFKQWVSSRDPLRYGVVVRIRVEATRVPNVPENLDWERAFMGDECEMIWARAEDILNHRVQV